MDLPATLRRDVRSPHGRSGARGPRAAFLLGLLLWTGGCGGGTGGSGPLPEPAVVQLGLAPSTLISTYTHTFRNPLAAQATVSAGPTVPENPFSISPEALPAVAPASGDVALPVRLQPLGVGVNRGSVTLLFVAGSQQATLTVGFAAEVEPVIWRVTPATLDFGLVLVGANAQQGALLENMSALSPVTLLDVTFPSSEFTLVSPPLPQTVQPGGSLAVTLRYEPTSAAADAGSIAFGLGSPGGPVRVDVTGNSPSREEITDFGSVAFDAAGFTPALSVVLPAEAISLTLEALGVGGDLLGLGLLTGPAGRVYENEQSTGAYIWYPGNEVFSTTVPNTDRLDVQLVPGGGEYVFRVRRLSGTSPSVRLRAIVERRAPGADSTGVLDLNVWLAQGLNVSAADAPLDPTLQAVLTRIDAILAGQGLRLGALSYFDVADPTYDFVEEFEFANLLRLSAAASQTRLNLFFVKQAIGGGVVGAAGTISGPKVNGTSVSGVMSVFEGFSTNTIGLVAAHEIGHFLGLFHTVEQDGSHDFIDDTADCPATGAGGGTCATEGGGYLMHWLALGNTALTAGQGLVLRGHPLVGPTPVVIPKPGVPSRGADRGAVPALEARAEHPHLPEGWCATCRRQRASRLDPGAGPAVPR